MNNAPKAASKNGKYINKPVNRIPLRKFLYCITFKRRTIFYAYCGSP